MLSYRNQVITSFALTLSLMTIVIVLAIVFRFFASGFPEGNFSPLLLYCIICYAFAPIGILTVLRSAPGRRSALDISFDLIASSFFGFLIALFAFSPMMISSMKDFLFMLASSLERVIIAFCFIVSFIVFPCLVSLYSLKAIWRTKAFKAEGRSDISPLAYMLISSSTFYMILRSTNIANISLSSLIAPIKANYHLVYLLPASLACILAWIGLIAHVRICGRSKIWILLGIVLILAVIWSVRTFGFIL